MTLSVIDHHTRHTYGNGIRNERIAVGFARDVAISDNRCVSVESDDPFEPPVAVIYPPKNPVEAIVEEQLMAQKLDLKQALQQTSAGAAIVRFEKKGGTIRRLYGTRDMDVIAALKPLAVPTKGKDNPADLVTIFDLDKLEWRSFRHEQFIDAEKAALPELPTA